MTLQGDHIHSLFIHSFIIYLFDSFRLCFSLQFFFLRTHNNFILKSSILSYLLIWTHSNLLQKLLQITRDNEITITIYCNLIYSLITILQLLTIINQIFHLFKHHFNSSNWEQTIQTNNTNKQTILRKQTGDNRVVDRKTYDRNHDAEFHIYGINRGILCMHEVR